MYACLAWLQSAGARFYLAAGALAVLAVPALVQAGLHAGWYTFVPGLFTIWCVGMAISDREWRLVHAVRGRRTAAATRAVG